MYFGTWSRLTWFLPPHSPVGGFATELYAAHYCHSRTAFGFECRTTGLTSKPHHAHGNFAPLMWIVSPATGIDFQPQTRLPCRPYYTAVPIGWQYVFPAKNNICVVFFRMSRRFRSKRKFILCFLRNYFEFAGSAPYARKCGVLCFELYFERMPFLPFLFYSPYAGFCKNCIRRHVKPESSSVQVCPKCFRCPRSIRIINPRKSVVKHLGAQNFDNSMKTR